MDFVSIELWHVAVFQVLSGFLSGKPSLFRQPIVSTQFRAFSQEAPEAVTTSSPSSVQPAEEEDKLFKRVEIELKGVDPAVMNSYTTFVKVSAEHLGVQVGEM